MIEGVRAITGRHNHREPIETNATAQLRPGQEHLFRSLWLLNIPVVVPDVTRRMQCSWSPQDFVHTHGHVRVKMIKMVDPSPVTVSVTVEEFFKQFSEENPARSYAVKVKDWPPSSSFEEHFKQHFDAFMDVVPFPSYTRHNGYRNVAAHWPDSPHSVPSFKPDLGKRIIFRPMCHYSHSTGPKMYIATRYLEEWGSTALHLDATSAVNLMVYSSSGDPQVPGALWHIFRPEDSDSIRAYLRDKGLYGEEDDPIHARKTYITCSMRLELAPSNVHGFEILQRPGDVVFIPAGCAHQVSNLHSCIKVACDFLCPEGITYSSYITQEFRRASIPDISLNSQSSYQTNRELTRVQARRKCSRETPRAQEDAARHKKKKRHRDQSTSTPSPCQVYKCPHPDCDQQDRTFVQANSVFSHL
ncbi:hypothetical protein LXA43DRAFT_976296 [Ganoderma leucocontextum]|nr:hypothetical protein LXA43DRAFT_976296 [Ganoderma leucocontextum]